MKHVKRWLGVYRNQPTMGGKNNSNEPMSGTRNSMENSGLLRTQRFLVSFTARLSMLFILVSLLSFSASYADEATSTNNLTLQNWSLISTATGANAVQASLSSYDASGWYPVKVPATVLDGLYQNSVVPQDIYFDTNLQSIDTTQFNVPWIYRTTFNVSDLNSKYLLKFNGINYRANLYVNGQLVIGSDSFIGTFREFEFDITPDLQVGANAIAVEITRPNDELFSNTSDLALTWIDWSHPPSDSAMGIWRDVVLIRIPSSQLVYMEYPVVNTQLNSDLSQAALTISAQFTNITNTPLTNQTCSANALGKTITATVNLKPGESRLVTFPNPMIINNPSLWWPWQMGPQTMNTLKLSCAGATLSSQFGIRQITKVLTTPDVPETAYLLFKVNGRPIFIRAAGYAQDLLLRETPDRIKMNMMYARDLGLNALRFEGQFGVSNDVYDLADQLGILMMPGLSCCDSWEGWSSWLDSTVFIAAESVKSQVRRLRIHPSMLTFWYSSDLIPLSNVTGVNNQLLNIGQAYNKILDDELWTGVRTLGGFAYSDGTPTDPSVGFLIDPYTGLTTGQKQSGPYQWVPPVVWVDGTYQKTFSSGTCCSQIGAWGFLEEGGPGEAPMTWESLIQNIPANQLWTDGINSPVSPAWNLHGANDCDICSYGSLIHFMPALYIRYGSGLAIKGARDFTVRSQIAAYESHRAYFEGFARNKYTQGPNQSNATTGFVQWMLENARPENTWHLFEYNGMPGGSYFGAKKASDPDYPLHAMLTPLVANLNNPSATPHQEVWVINSSYQPVKNSKVSVRIFSLDGQLKQSLKSSSFDIDPDASKKITDLIIPIPSQLGLTGVYFVELRIGNNPPNVYWLSADPLKQDVIDWANQSFGNYLQLAYADLTALTTLPQVQLTNKAVSSHSSSGCTIKVTVKNSTRSIAFGVRLRLVDAAGKDILPIRWSDNFITIFPKEAATVNANYDTKDNSCNNTLIVEPFNNLINQPDPN